VIRTLCAILTILSAGLGCRTLPNARTSNEVPTVISIGPFRARDATNHGKWIQQRLDQAKDRPVVFEFSPGDYILADAEGLRVPTGATLMMTGARFLLAKEIQADGQAFLLDSVQDVILQGGEIVGARSTWDPGVNVAGVRVAGSAANIRITDLTCRDLSSNAVGVFGESADTPIRNVSLTRVVGINCCNVYVDYLQSPRGPAPGSDRRDQGTVALYYVDGWSVDACRFENSQSDGTHFFQSRNGRFTNSSVTGSRMGGYFLEGCENVLATGNLIRENGSRGVTIERDSRFCTLASSLIMHSGREGLWMPDVSSIIVTDNIFVENGRKDDGEKDCEIRLDDTAEYKTETRDVRIGGNIFRTSAHQTAVIYSGAGVHGLAVDGNTFHGPAPTRN
jgi:hypothetical protein